MCAQLTRDLLAIAKFLFLAPIENGVEYTGGVKYMRDFQPIDFYISKTIEDSRVTSNPGSMKNRDFRPVSRFISEMIQDRAIFAMERQ